MARYPSTPSFAMLLQRFFVDHLQQHRALSPRTISAYRDTFKLLLHFAEKHLRKTPVTLALADLDAEFLSWPSSITLNENGTTQLAAAMPGSPLSGPF